MRDPGDQGQSSQKRAGGVLGKGKGRGLPETGDAGRAPCATGVGGRWGVELARGAGRGGSWVPLWQESKVAVVPWFGPKQQERDGKDKKRNWDEMVALGRGRPWVPLARDAQQQQDWSRAKGRATGKSRTGAAEACRGKELKHQS